MSDASIVLLHSLLILNYMLSKKEKGRAHIRRLDTTLHMSHMYIMYMYISQYLPLGGTSPPRGIGKRIQKTMYRSITNTIYMHTKSNIATIMIS